MLSYVKNMKYLYIRIALVCLTLGIGLFFVFSQQYFDTRYNKSVPTDNVVVLQLHQGEVLEQSVYFEKGKVHSIGICVLNRTNDAIGNLEVAITDSNGQRIWSEKAPIDAIELRKTKWFQVNGDVNDNQKYMISVSAIEIDGTIQVAGISAEQNARGVDEEVLINGLPVSTTTMMLEMAYYQRLSMLSKLIILVWTTVAIYYILMFDIVVKNIRMRRISIFITAMIAVICAYAKLGIGLNERQEYLVFFGIIGGIIVAVAICSWLVVKGEERVERYFIVTAVLFGILYSFILSPYSAPDEDRHFFASYRLSNILMGQQAEDEYGHIYMRACDVNEYGTYANKQDMLSIVRALVNGENDKSTEIVASQKRYAPNASVVLYFPQAVGICIARLMNVNYIRLVYFGRFMNLFVFIVITALAIRLLPYGKWIVYAISQIPIVMELVSSYSYDATIIALTFLLISYILNLMEQKEQVSTRQWIILAVISLIYAPLKPVYVPFIALGFLIPFKRKSAMSWKDFVYITSIFLLSVVMVVVVHKCSFLMLSSIGRENKIQPDEKIVNNEMVIDEEEALSIKYIDHYEKPNVRFILENPFDLIESYMGTFLNCFDEFLLSAFGGYLGWYDVELPVFIPIMAMFFLYMSFAYEDYQISSNMLGYKRGWVLLMLFGCWFAILLTFYLRMTSPSQKILGGVQGRYFTPSFALSIFFLQGKHRKNENMRYNMVMMSMLINTLAIMNICMIIWNR